jgi:hypothetical protein
MFNKVKEAIENAIQNGYEPLAMKARDLAEDLADKASDFAEDKLEDITDAVKAVKTHFGAENKDDA